MAELNAGSSQGVIDTVRATHDGPWRTPYEETMDLYPGFVVHDGRQSGSITFGPTRIPIWCITGEWFHGQGWDGVESGWGLAALGWDERKMADFVYYLFQQRGEFARLLLTLADVERKEHTRRGWPKSWWQMKKERKRVRAALMACVKAIDIEDGLGG